MGSASRIALGEAREILAGLSKSANVGAQLLDAAAELGRNSSLLATVADAAINEKAKTDLIEKVFAPASADAKKVLAAVATGRWSNEQELVAGVEELGIRGEATMAPEIADELLAIEKVIASDHELELTLGSKLGGADAKVGLVEKLLSGKVSASALGIAKHIVANPRGRRIGRALQDFATVAADQGGQTLATVTVAAPLDEARIERLEKQLTASQGRAVKITSVVDPSVIGGMRIRIADEVIDATVKSQLDNLRLQLSL